MSTQCSSPSEDERYLDQAIDLAERGRGAVEPNPMVGCVIVKNGRVIGQGFHERFGGPHAEPTALANCHESPEGATLYVNLEPCCHTNKKTPPCVPQLIAARIRRVVVGCADPNPAVLGMGVTQLRAAGIAVTIPVREAESKQLNTAFFAGQTLRRPYVTLKWAQSADGKVAGPGGQRLQISGERARRAAHLLRAQFDAILIGVGTAVTDDPVLTTRGVDPHRTLLRVVLDSTARLSPASRLARTSREHSTHLFCVDAAFDASREHRAAALRACGVEVHETAGEERGRVALPEVLNRLAHELGVTHLLVEGGPTIHASFLRQHLADRAWVVRSPMRVGAPNAPSAALLSDEFEPTFALGLAPDELREYLNRQSPVFFRASASVETRRLGDRIAT